MNVMRFIIETSVFSFQHNCYRDRKIFFEYGKLKTIPSQKKKERIVLEVIAQAFEFDRIYSEREVNIIIADFHDFLFERVHHVILTFIRSNCSSICQLFKMKRHCRCCNTQPFSHLNLTVSTPNGR